MSLEKISLQYVKILSVSGKAFEIEESSDSEPHGLKARFGLTIDTNNFTEQNNYSFEVFQSLETLFSTSEDEESFFKIEIKGVYCARDSSGVEEWVNSEAGAYTLGVNLFAYLRNLSKPILEHLGAAELDFPWSPPGILKKIVEESAKPRKRRKKPN